MITRLFFSFALLMAVCSANGQNISNGSFENWEDAYYSKQAEWNTLGNVETVTDASEGNSAVKVMNVINDPFDIGFGIVTNINIGGVGLNGGWDYDEVPLSANIDAKFDLTPGDSAQVVFGFQKSGSLIGIAQLYINGNSNDTFTQFSIPIQWFLTATPDTIQVMLTSRNINKSSSNGNGYVIYDNIRLTSFSTEHRNVLNPSFETMDTDTIAHPTDWMTSDMVLYSNLGVRLPQPAVSASNDRKEGGSAMKLSNVSYGNDEIAPGVAIPGTAFVGLDKPSLAVSKRWNYIEGWWKYSSGIDSARIVVVMFKNGQPIGVVSDSILEPRTEWDYFAFPIQYATADVPDSALLIISSANYDDPLGTNATLLIDEIAFTDVASVDRVPYKDFKIGPVPVVDDLFIESEVHLTGSIEVYDPLGKRMLREEIGGQRSMTIHTAGWNTGIYYLIMKSDSGNTVVKFNKQ